jgi:DNA-binding transcriptional MerR regulator
MQTTALKSVQMAESEQQRHMLKIGEVSKRSGIGIETLRFYEKSGLLDNPERTDSGYRIYDAQVLERLAFIKRAQVLGFSLDEIKRVMDERRAGQSPCAEVRELVRLRLHELDERMQEMQRYRQELVATLAEWDEVGEAEGLICGLIEGSNFERGTTQTQSKLLAGKKK